jgi:chemotaxis protein CheD
MKRIVQIADMIVSDDPDDLLITYALGPCLGVSMHDPLRGVGGLIHCQLPSAKDDAARARLRPLQFVDTGVLALLERLFEMGACRSNLVIKCAGAAKVVENLTLFKISERNHTVFRKLMWKNDLLIAAEEVGGSRPRTMSLEIGTGRTWLQCESRTWEFEAAKGARREAASAAVAASIA